RGQSWPRSVRLTGAMTGPARLAPSEGTLTLSLARLAGLRYRVLAVGAGPQRGIGLVRQLVEVAAQVVLVVVHLVIGGDLPRVGGQAAHRRDQARLGPALRLVVGLVVADGGDEMVPLQPIRVRLVRRRLPGGRLAGDVLALEDAALRRRVRVGRDDR